MAGNRAKLAAAVPGMTLAQARIVLAASAGK
jgi:hypothetical protein